jgi:hypothetical protein
MKDLCSWFELTPTIMQYYDNSDLAIATYMFISKDFHKTLQKNIKNLIRHLEKAILISEIVTMKILVALYSGRWL